MRFLFLLSLPCHDHFRATPATVVIPLMFQAVALAVIVLLIVTVVIYLELTVGQAGTLPGASNFSSHLLISTTLKFRHFCLLYTDEETSE